MAGEIKHVHPEKQVTIVHSKQRLLHVRLVLLIVAGVIIVPANHDSRSVCCAGDIVLLRSLFALCRHQDCPQDASAKATTILTEKGVDIILEDFVVFNTTADPVRRSCTRTHTAGPVLV